MRTLFDVSVLLDPRRDHWVLALMLLVLHAALQLEMVSPLARALMTAHLGLFFLWQPIWQREQRLDWSAVALILVFAATFVGTLSAWWLFAWLILLIGIVTGRARAVRRERITYMLTLACLVCELLINVVPLLFATGAIEPAVRYVFNYGLYGVPLVIGCIPVASGARQTYPIDFFRGIIVALLTALLALGSVLMTLRQALDYPSALFFSLLAVASFLVFISWLVTPATGTGLGALWEKSVLNIGTPFEAWMASLADLAARIHVPDEFLHAALDELVATPWVAGACWEDATGAHQSGIATARSTRIETELLTVTLFLDRPPGPTLLLHCRLLIETLSYFQAAKQRAQEQAHQAHLQAIYATGARLTHDIKNLLQSLKLLATATTRVGQEEQSLQLLQRQLPLIANRLQTALDKLNRPTEETGEHQALAHWWAQFRARHASSGITLSAQIDDGELPVPGECLDSVLENLLENARDKAAGDETIALAVELVSQRDQVRITVADTGAPLPTAVLPLLFRQVVPSRNGLGVGLYQAAQLAARVGFALRLVANRQGEVRFEVSNQTNAAT